MNQEALQHRNRRVELYRNLVRPVAMHYAHRCPESCEDLIQVGLLGLIRAAELYRPETGTPFEAFARPHVRGAILHYLRDEAPRVRLPRRQAELQERLQRLEAGCRDLNAAASGELLRRQLGLDAEQWQLLQRQRLLNRPMPLEEAQLEALAAPQVNEPTESGVQIEALLNRLEPRQRRVVRQVVLEGCSYRRLAQQMAVSPMTVQRLLRRGLDSLRTLFEQRSLRLDQPAHHGGSGLRAC